MTVPVLSVTTTKAWQSGAEIALLDEPFSD
jgi:hypothetical protein